jgi:hypothetical protein
LVTIESQGGQPETLSHLGTRVCGGADKHRVEDVAPWYGVERDAVRGDQISRNQARADVEGAGGENRAAGRDQVVEQPPALQASEARLVDQVAGDGVTGKRSPIDKQYAITAAGQKHRQR